ncbi:uncharacterized protein [Ptychodera flava]|uniref:uncharacterized protein isoform X2 n=1 Tax=Ptychodera flava TaxID=63121 RepID=UPI00396A4694
MSDTKVLRYFLVLSYTSALAAVGTDLSSPFNKFTLLMAAYNGETLTLTGTTNSTLETLSPLPCNDSLKNIYGTCYCGPWNGKENARRDLERKVLKEIYHGAHGDLWNNFSLWLVNCTDHCQWYGICCNEHGFVSKILLAENNMTGHLPDLSRLEYLDCLNVNSNRLSGKLSDFLKPNMTNLQNLTLSFKTSRDL